MRILLFLAMATRGDIILHARDKLPLVIYPEDELQWKMEVVGTLLSQVILAK